MSVPRNHDAAAAVRNGRLNRGVRSDSGISHLNAGCITTELDPVAEIARDDTCADQIVAARRCDQNSVASVRSGPRERKDPSKRVERGEAAGRTAHLDAVLVIAGDHVTQRNHAADLRILGRAGNEQPVAAVGDDGSVVGAHSHEIRLHGRIVGIRDSQAILTVAAEHVVKDERILRERASDQLIAVGAIDGDAVQPVAQGGVSRGGRADVVAAQQRLRGAAVDEDSVGAVAGDQVALSRTDEHARRGIVRAGRLAANDVPRRALRDENAVLPVAKRDCAACIRANVVHGDQIVIRVNSDAVATIAADDVRQLESRVDRRLVG